MLIEYIRTPKHYEPRLEILPNGTPRAYINETGGDPIGVIVAIAKNEVGWSLCSKKDCFNKEMGKKIATNRAEYYGRNKTQCLLEVPESIYSNVLKMYERSQKYFK